MLAVSSPYETEPLELAGQPWFLNAAVAFETGLSPRQLLQLAVEIELGLGRQRTVPKGPRTIDLDILLLGDLTLNEPDLKIPHPAMHLRRFVLEPLVEIAPAAWHPTLSKTALDLLDELRDPSVVRRLSGATLA